MFVLPEAKYLSNFYKVYVFIIFLDGYCAAEFISCDIYHTIEKKKKTDKGGDLIDLLLTGSKKLRSMIF